jgi:hypothetical protein
VQVVLEPLVLFPQAHRVHWLQVVQQAQAVVVAVQDIMVVEDQVRHQVWVDQVVEALH